MKMQSLSHSELYHQINSILSYQFNSDVANKFLEPFDSMKIQFSRKTGKIKQILLNNILQASYRGNLGTFTLSLDAISRILPYICFPQFRVQVKTEVAEFIKTGKSVFAQHVIKLDPNLKVGDEVIVVDESDQLLAIGKLALPPHYIPFFQNGGAVKVRKGILSGKK